jgi:hypothetical protein
MRNFLFSLRTRALLLIGFAFSVFVGTVKFHATGERQMRLKFVSIHLQDTAKLIAAHHAARRPCCSIRGNLLCGAMDVKPYSATIPPIPAFCDNAAFYGAQHGIAL